MAMRQLMADVRPDEEAALRALVQPVEPVAQPQDGVVLGYCPTAQLINPTVPLVTLSPRGSAVVGAVVEGPGPMRPLRTRSRMQRACTHWKCTFCKAEWALSLQMTQCGSCGGVRRQLGNADAEAREAARLRQRSTSVHGRRLNGQSTAGRFVPRMPQGVFEKARFDHLAKLQTGLLERAAGKPQYVTHQDYLASRVYLYVCARGVTRGNRVRCSRFIYKLRARQF